MRRVRDAISEVLDRTTLADLIKQVDSGRAERALVENLMYDI
jgi:DNA-binding IscR family transcriptional regulator